MNNIKNLEYEIRVKLENATTKIATKVCNVLNHEGIAGIIADTQREIFWFESYSSGNNCPKFVYDWLKKYIKREYGYGYLYDVTAKQLEKATMK